ncbi:MAG: acetate--CoA ligase family protein [Methanolinea sp.]|nr:acetate--CoA ligase family protein [Methanolinea sp.]
MTVYRKGGILLQERTRTPGAEPRLLPEEEAFSLLAGEGVTVPRHEVVSSPEDAARAAGRLGFPLVAKVISPDIVHKTDAGGVVRGIRSAEEASSAYSTIVARVRESVPGAEIRGIILEEECAPGLELLVGGRTDPAFGKVLTFGMGGTLVELIRDVAIRVLPLDRDALQRMVREIKGYPLIRGYRGQPPLDEEALVDLLLGISRMFEGNPGIVEFDFNPLILYEHGCVVVDARVYSSPGIQVEEDAPSLPIDSSLFYPESIAVIGASADPKKIGYAVLRNLLSFPGKLYPVNPHQTEILGKTAYKSVTDIPGDVDVAVIAIPALSIPAVMEDLVQKGVGLVIILSSGFRESGAAGAKLEEQILAIARRSGIRIVGPNCLGIILPPHRINSTFDPISPVPGDIGFISQSGAVITTIVDWSVLEQIGFSVVISVGNQLDLGFVDFLRVVAADPHTKAIILYIEEIKKGRDFLATVREIARTKPVIALKSGTSVVGQKAASSHTGSLAGSYEVYQAAFRQAGVIPVMSIQEAFDVAQLLASEGYPAGNRAVVITSAGGFAVLASDYAERYGIALNPPSPELIAALDAVLPPMWNRSNPFDLIGDGGADRYAKVFDIMARFQEEWDIAVVIGVPSSMLDANHLGQEIARFSRITHKMIVGCLLGGESMKSGIRVLHNRYIPNYSEVEMAFRSIGRSLQALHRE